MISDSEIQPFMKNYKSVSWALLMGAWFYDFMSLYCKNLVENREATNFTIVKEAYDKGLAPHHPWYLRAAAFVGLNAVVSRESLIESMT